MEHMESRGTPVQVYISRSEKLMQAVLCIQEGRRKEVAATLLQETVAPRVLSVGVERKGQIRDVFWKQSGGHLKGIGP